MTEPDIETLCKRLEAETRGPFVESSDRALYAQAATALRSEHARAVKAEGALWDGEAPVSWQERALKAESRALTAEAALADAQAAVKVLREAVRPFAEAAERWNDPPSVRTADNVELWQRGARIDYLTVGNLRSARAVLAQTASYGEGE